MAIWLAAIVSGAVADGSPDAAARLREFTGGPAKLAWIRQVAGNGDDPFCWGSQLVIMGLDTEDGRGAREIVGEVANYHRPMVSPNGKQVVFSRIQTREAFVTDWDGGEPRRLGKGYAAAVWQDPATDAIWVYMADSGKEGWDRHRGRALHRVRIDNPSIRELVWDKATFTVDNLQLSADGTRACSQFPPDPRCGFADFVKQAWTPLRRGCWTSMAPDNSYCMWVFDGPHRNIYIHDPFSGESWQVPINTAPGMDGFEVYHPRWSSHRRYFSLTGPYRNGKPGNNLIGAGGPDVNIWIGKFSDDLKTVEGWRQITDDRFGNFYPDLWIARKADDRLPAPAAGISDSLPAAPGSYPTGLVMLWENANDLNDAGARRWNALTRGRAFWGPFGEMELDGGFFRIVPDDGLETKHEPRSSVFTLEALIRSGAPGGRANSPATIAANLDETGTIWALEQVGERLRLRFALDAEPVEQVLDLGEAVAARAVHLLVVRRKRSVGVWRDGKQVSNAALMPEPVAWAPRSIFIGQNGPDAPSSSWKGRIEGLALYERELGKEEIAARYDRVRVRLAKRTETPEYEVVARLEEALAPPAAESILPYRRALLAQIFKVESAPAESALSPGEEIAVAHWTVLDGEVQPRAFKSGGRYRLRITPFKDRPILEAERMFLDADFVLLPVFYEIEENAAEN